MRGIKLASLQLAVALPLLAGAVFGQPGDVIGSNDLGHGLMRWALGPNAVVWHVPGGSFPNTVAYNGTDVFHVTGDAGCSPLLVRRISAATGATLGTLTLAGNPGGLCTHLEDLAFSSAIDLWATDLGHNRLVRYNITTGLPTQILPIIGSFSNGTPVNAPTGIASTPAGMFASMGFNSSLVEIGVIDLMTGIYNTVFTESPAPYASFYIHSLAYDSVNGVLWENLSFAGPFSSQILRPRFLNGASAGPDVILNPSPVSGRFDGFEHLSTPVGPGNEPPDCRKAVASAAELWPPNHKFVDVSVKGVTDPDGDSVNITITGIFQDEPIDGLGDGDTCPDAAGVGESTASLRVERAGTPWVPGDGRVYHVSFTADDGNGGRCSGTVTVCVPHDQRPGHVCVDQGPLVNSTGPC